MGNALCALRLDPRLDSGMLRVYNLTDMALKGLTADALRCAGVSLPWIRAAGKPDISPGFTSKIVPATFLSPLGELSQITTVAAVDGVKDSVQR